jgi:hypothetical protein
VFSLREVDVKFPVSENVSATDYVISALVYFNLTSFAPYQTVFLDLTKVNWIVQFINYFHCTSLFSFLLYFLCLKIYLKIVSSYYRCVTVQYALAIRKLLRLYLIHQFNLI